MLDITKSAPYYVLKSSLKFLWFNVAPGLYLNTPWIGKGGRKRKRTIVGTPRSVLYQGEPCRAASDRLLVCGVAADNHLQALTFYFPDQVLSTTISAYAVFSLVLVTSAGCP